MSVVAWEDPPRTGKGHLEEIRRDLQAHPNRWAKIEAGLKRTQATGYYKTLRRPDFEVTVRNAGRDKYDVYAKYVGEAIAS